MLPYKKQRAGAVKTPAPRTVRESIEELGYEMTLAHFGISGQLTPGARLHAIRYCLYRLAAIKPAGYPMSPSWEDVAYRAFLDIAPPTIEELRLQVKDLLKRRRNMHSNGRELLEILNHLLNQTEGGTL